MSYDNIESTMISNIPSHFFCPLTLKLMKNPVTDLTSGITFEKSAINKWLDRGKTDRRISKNNKNNNDGTSLRSSEENFVENTALLEEINQWKMDNRGKAVNDNDDTNASLDTHDDTNFSLETSEHEELAMSNPHYNIHENPHNIHEANGHEIIEQTIEQTIEQARQARINSLMSTRQPHENPHHNIHEANGHEIIEQTIEQARKARLNSIEQTIEQARQERINSLMSTRQQQQQQQQPDDRNSNSRSSNNRMMSRSNRNNNQNRNVRVLQQRYARLRARDEFQSDDLNHRVRCVLHRIIKKKEDNVPIQRSYNPYNPAA